MGSARCIFCASPDLTREHLWPKWAGAVLRPPDYKGKRSEVYIVKTKKTQTISREQKHHHGHTVDKSIRVVCGSCNNEWMSQLEDDVKPIALPLIQGDIFDLTPAMQVKLSQWVVLKTFVAEQHRPDEATFPQDARDAFKAHRTIPAGVRIFIGRCIAKSWSSTYMRHAALLSNDPAVVPNAGRKNVQTIALGMGDLFVFVTTSVTDGVDLHDFVDFGKKLIPLHPGSGNVIIWPPMYIISEGEAREIAWALEMLMQSHKTIWKETPQ